MSNGQHHVLVVEGMVNRNSRCWGLLARSPNQARLHTAFLTCCRDSVHFVVPSFPQDFPLDS